MQQHACHLRQHVVPDGGDVGEASVGGEGGVEFQDAVGFVVGLLDEGEEGAPSGFIRGCAQGREGLQSGSLFVLIPT